MAPVNHTSLNARTHQVIFVPCLLHLNEVRASLLHGWPPGAFLWSSPLQDFHFLVHACIMHCNWFKQKRDFFYERMLGGSHNCLLRLEIQAWKLHSQESYSKSCNRAVRWKQWVTDIGSRATVLGHWLLQTACFYTCHWRLQKEAGKHDLSSFNKFVLSSSYELGTLLDAEKVSQQSKKFLHSWNLHSRGGRHSYEGNKLNIKLTKWW